VKKIFEKLRTNISETKDIKEALYLGRSTWYLLLIVQLLFVPVTSVFDIVLIKIVIDKVIFGGRLNLLFPIALCSCGALLIFLSVEVWVQYRSIHLGQFWDGMIKSRFLRTILHKPLEFFQRFPTGEILYRILNDSAILPNYMTQMRWSFIINIFVMAVIVALMFYLDIPLSLLVLVTIPLQAWSLRKVGHKCRNIYEKLKFHDQELLSSLDNITAHAESLKAFSLENRARRDWLYDYKARLQTERRLLIFQRILMPIILRINGIMTIAVICYGSYRVVTGTLSMGTFMAFLIVAARFQGPVYFLATYHVSLQDIIMCCRRVRATWQALEHNIRPDTHLLSKPFPISYVNCTRGPNRLILSEVDYAYPNGKQVLRGIKWEISTGEIYRMRGENGSGKSTLLKVAAGLLIPQKGQVFYDETNIRKIKSIAIRSKIMYLSSENYWFKGTVGDNIYYGVKNKNHFNKSHLEQLAKITGVYCLLERLPQGLNTLVSTGGKNFSSGERQRLALLRILLNRPAYVFLDESLTSICSEDAADMLSQIIYYLGRDSTVVYVHHGVDFNLPQQININLHKGVLLEK